MAKKPISRITELAAKIDKHLHQFEPMDYETDYSPVSRQEVEKKKRNPLFRAGIAGGTVAGAAAIAGNKDKIKAGAMDATNKIKTRAKDLANRGVKAGAGAMEKAGAKVANAGIDAAGKLRGGKVAGAAADALEKGSIKAGNKLLKGAGKLKKLTGFEGKALAGQMVRIQRKLQEFAAQ